jgi:hypothetical protein
VREDEKQRRARELQEETEVLTSLPIVLQNRMLPARYQHLSQAIDRLKRRGEIELLPNGGIGPRWARSEPGLWP